MDDLQSTSQGFLNHTIEDAYIAYRIHWEDRHTNISVLEETSIVVSMDWMCYPHAQHPSRETLLVLPAQGSSAYTWFKNNINTSLQKFHVTLDSLELTAFQRHWLNEVPHNEAAAHES